MVVYCAVGAIRWVMADDGVRQPPKVGKWRTSGTQRLVSRRIPARYAALCVPGYGRVPSLCDERVQTEGCVDIYNRSSAVVARVLASRGRQANPVLTYETALRRFFVMVVYCAVGAIRWVMADDGVRQPPVVWEVGKCESRR